ncbi:MAG: DUF4139 domain-containing protein [Spirochaetales bacterium]|nr:DUF4139 domain-containing protein [Spirochaetales bacterium]
MGWRMLPFALLLAISPLTAQTVRHAELPVTNVVLYSSGVGYFEHSGTIDGKTEVDLPLRASQLNDALKSMVLNDPEASSVWVDYPSSIPLARTLESFAINLSSTGGLVELLPQLRGVAMTVLTPRAVTGRLVGWDRRPSSDGKSEVLVITLATGEGLVSFPLSNSSEVKLLDPVLDHEIAEALQGLGVSRDENRKVLRIQFEGQGRQKVSLGYVTEAPVWKTSYRLDLAGHKAELQAWAIVENTTEADWKDVSLTLVAGRPLSFIQDLYTPLFVARPVVPASVEAAPLPRASEQGAAPEMSAQAPAPRAMKMLEMAPSSLSESLHFPQVEAAQAGELFQFHLKQPVTLARQQSALLPLVQTKVSAQKVDVYNQSVLSDFPLNAVWVDNTTEMNLPAGPITVYDGGIYAGDALTTSVVPGERRLWTYAVDPAVTVDSSQTQSQKTTKIVIVDGVLNENQETSYKQVYTLTNHGKTPKTLLVEYPSTPGRTLAEPTVWVEKTPSLYRFRVELGAGLTVNFPVVEKRTVVSRQALFDLDPQSLTLLISQNQPLSAAVRQALRKAGELKAALVSLEREMSSLVQQKNELSADEARLRENLVAVGRDSPQGQSYLQKLGEAETKIETLEFQLSQKGKDQQTARKNLEDFLRHLSLE